jgi:Xaa-Pro aminopeptidase
VFEARAAAHDAIRPGVAAKQVDAAAREVMTCRGFGEQFRHATGHGVGFAAIDHNALPRISTDSTDVLERGMVFNIEPAVYVKGFSGIRHCDVIAVTGSGAQVLTPFQASLEDLIV